MTDTSHQLIKTAMGKAPGLSCQLCGATSTSRKRLKLHARLHYVHAFCRCGYNSKWRETIRTHQKDSRNPCNILGPVYEVDAASFTRWKRALKVNLSTYPGEIPTRIIPCAAPPVALQKKERTTPSSGPDDSTCARVRIHPPPATDARATIQQKQQHRPSPPANPANAHRLASTSAKSRPVFSASTSDTRYAHKAVVSSTAMPSFCSDGSSRWEQALTNQSAKRSRSPASPRKDPSATSTDCLLSPSTDKEMRRLIRRTEDRFHQMLRLARDQDADIADMYRVMKRPRHH